MPRQRSLTLRQIGTAALAVVDRGGLGALSMRVVAEELGVGTMSLYRYVEDREQLEGLIVDTVLAEVDTDVPRRRSWRGQAATLLERVHQAIGAHPEVVPLVLARRQSSEGTLAWAEALLGVLDAAGFSGLQRVVAFRALVSYTVGAIQVEHLGPLSGTGTAVIADLPADRYPLLRETARRAQRLRPADEFMRGLDGVLRGLRP